VPAGENPAPASVLSALKRLRRTLSRLLGRPMQKYGSYTLQQTSPAGPPWLVSVDGSHDLDRILHLGRGPIVVRRWTERLYPGFAHVDSGRTPCPHRWRRARSRVSSDGSILGCSPHVLGLSLVLNVVLSSSAFFLGLGVEPSLDASTRALFFGVSGVCVFLGAGALGALRSHRRTDATRR
jgi:hypothetical protein